MSEQVTNACQCQLCRASCQHKPGWFAPEEIEPLALAMGITVKELFERHLSVDWWDGDELTDYERVFVLSPRLAGEDGGDMFPGDPKGKCHWFLDGKCSVHSLGKPSECRFSHHDMDRSACTANRKEIVLAWMKHQPMIEELLGRTPAAQEWEGGSIFDLLGLSF